jgi:hypothetical protein
MTARKHRATSKAAHESVKEHKAAMYEKIKEGLKRLRIGGTFEEIARASGLKSEQVWKRLPEMVDFGMVYNVGITRSTSSGRKAMVRQLVGMKAVDIAEEQPARTKAEQRAKVILKQLSLL